MAYRIRRKDSKAQIALRRIAREQVHAAIRSLDTNASTADAIHDVRKRIKKIRSLLRLVGPSFDGYRDENVAFRAIAAPLGPQRDADVLIETFDSVLDPAGPGVPDSVAQVRQRLVQHGRTIGRAHDPTALRADARVGLEAALGRIATWRLAEDGFAAFAQGLEASYRRARKAMRAARETGKDDAFHTWRKRTKDHGFHLRLLQPVWPGPMRAIHVCAAQLGDTLGLHHDLAVLDTHLQCMRDVDEAVIAALRTRIAQAQRLSEARAHALGVRLYAESPAALARSWRRRHAAWRDGR
ncbi:conserved hypothetical protein [Luteimonas sp. 9C]|uniref:CHAD domain-containing protein n=1 Tax=Luteimonas sp. 9C TaxID=2653148 RepID=UPI0012F00F46|nr:CHAD domain-containing protein [Luteimonas sp. 9C]VXB32540.1 conserved hypothetical protein [Luteimonas sp. 9C]